MKKKFRIWDKENKEMSFQANIFNNKQPLKRVSTGPGRMNNLLIDIEIMQHTGLKDKNGVEIYEGDIVLYDDENRGRAEVLFKDGCFVTRFLNGDTYSFNMRYLDEYEIIGNIYTTPELLPNQARGE